MSHRNATTTTGYIVAAVVLVPFFWLTLGDAYGRFMITFDPAGSRASDYLEHYTGHVTGLVCLAAPMVLAYFLKTIAANTVDSALELLSDAFDWLLVLGRKWLPTAWQRASQVLLELRQARYGWSTNTPGPTVQPHGLAARLSPM